MMAVLDLVHVSGMGQMCCVPQTLMLIGNTGAKMNYDRNDASTYHQIGSE